MSSEGPKEYSREDPEGWNSLTLRKGQVIEAEVPVSTDVTKGEAPAAFLVQRVSINVNGDLVLEARSLGAGDQELSRSLSSTFNRKRGLIHLCGADCIGEGDFALHIGALKVYEHADFEADYVSAHYRRAALKWMTEDLSDLEDPGTRLDITGGETAVPGEAEENVPAAGEPPGAAAKPAQSRGIYMSPGYSPSPLRERLEDGSHLRAPGGPAQAAAKEEKQKDRRRREEKREAGHRKDRKRESAKETQLVAIKDGTTKNLQRQLLERAADESIIDGGWATARHLELLPLEDKWCWRLESTPRWPLASPTRIFGLAAEGARQKEVEAEPRAGEIRTGKPQTAAKEKARRAEKEKERTRIRGEETKEEMEKALRGRPRRRSPKSDGTCRGPR